jgi:hypothetical protein
VDVRFVRLRAAVADVRVAQGGYVAPGQQDGPWLARVASLVRQISNDITALREHVRGPDAAVRLARLSDAITKLFDTDTRAREHVRGGNDLMAADLLFRDAHETAASITAMLRELNDAEVSAFDSARSALRARERLVVGGTAILWTLGLLLLVSVPSRRPVAAAGDVVEPLVEPEPHDAPSTTGATTPTTPALDLGAAAALCTALSRASTTAALPDLLARAATILDASGLIVWMAAGDDLFAVSAHGYDPRVISRLGPIVRSADNATATAWRLGRMRTVIGDATSNGAIVAPMFGPEDCIGVLAAEVRHGRERDESAQAVTVMFAAQLATVIAAWPAASAPTGTESTVPATRDADPTFKAAGL